MHTCRPSNPDRSRPGSAYLNRRHGGPGGVYRGALPRAPQANAGTGPHSRGRREISEIFGRDSGGLVRSYRTEDAETIIVALGSVLGTIKDAVDERRDAGEKIGVLGITSFRPFPMLAIRSALRHAQRVIILEKALAIGLGGIVSDNVRNALSGITLRGNTVIAGLGGRAITKASLHRLFDRAEGRRTRAAGIPGYGLGPRPA